ncbi:formylglycine-generating enzyme family protein [Bremerella alba]|uniref:Hercynine oxygenase n=1 Tax=Bremerella alba TaxID=980252 RepID=A0A7V8V634_9BACT|nr:formylglycine-generating enzyme family protein [Bremerella alba]MBA2115638.1 Hercynine oxygenase [Bremerella alba]
MPIRLMFAFLVCCFMVAVASAQDTEKFINSIEMTFQSIPAGEFQMGREQSYKYVLDHTLIYAGVDRAIRTEVPPHKVHLASFSISMTEVTQQQWEAVMATRPWHEQLRVKEGPQFPASYISWEDAVEFCRRLSEKEGRTYRLPTEAEWEYACRAETNTLYSFGDNSDELVDFGWFAENANLVNQQYAHRVGRQKPNPWGLYDMHGNVWEWCHDFHAADYYAKSSVDNPTGPESGATHVIRGGSWHDSNTHARSMFRFGYPANEKKDKIGFRVVLTSPSKD